MPQRVEDFWCDTYEKHHGCRYRFTKADGVLLRGLMKQFPKRSIAWAITEYHRTTDDAWLEQRGWDVRTFRTRMQGYYVKWVKRFGEPELDQQQKQLSEQLELMAEAKPMLRLVRQVGREE